MKINNDRPPRSAMSLPCQQVEDVLKDSTQLDFIDERVKTTTDIAIKINKLSYNKNRTRGKELSTRI